MGFFWGLGLQLSLGFCNRCWVLEEGFGLGFGDKMRGREEKKRRRRATRK